MRCAVNIGLLLAALFACGQAQAAAPKWDAAYYNPVADADDVILPMPCGGAMAFRKVTLPALDAMHDEKIRLGNPDEVHGYSEYARTAYLAGSFPGKKSSEAYYLLGKYEVNQLQYDALGKAECPTPAMTMRLPVTKISWFDAVAFADRYNLWLEKEAKDALPKRGDQPGYVRLPTETEWEFAARGGMAVSESEYRDTLFPMPEGKAAYGWFSGPDSSGGSLRFTGLLKSNPLKLHDMIGNASEMTFDLYHLRTLQRDHGMAGGFAARGGDIDTPEAELRTSLRDEIPFYRDGKAWSSKTMGLRLALSATVISSHAELKNIQEAWGKLGQVKTAQASSDPLQILKKMEKETDDPATQESLKQVHQTIEAQREDTNEKRDLAARMALRYGTALCVDLGKEARKLEGLNEVYQQCKKDHAMDCDALYGGDSRPSRDALSLLQKRYADFVVEMAGIFEPEVIDLQLKAVESAYEQQHLDAFVPYARKFREHVQQHAGHGLVEGAAWMKACRGLKP